MKRTFNTEAIQNNRKNPWYSSILDIRKYILFPKDNAVTASLFSNQLYEDYLYKFLYSNQVNISGTNVIDIGGNNGQISIEFAHLVGDSGKVFTFEPQRIIYQQLCGNIFLNGLDNVYAYNVAIGSENGLTTIEKPNYFDEGFVNFGNIHVGVKQNFDVVELRTLDSYNLENISIIKIDVQGFEKKVLLGAKETLKKNRPIIYIEIEEEQLKLYGDSEDSILVLLSEMEYSYTRFNECKPYKTDSGLCLDFVALPNEMISQKDWKTIFD